MKVVTAPNVDYYLGNLTVFLAGAIDMGKAVNWQAEVIDKLKDLPNLTIYNPRRIEDFAPHMLDEQIKWELEMLNVCDLIFMWFPRDALAPISFFEAGLFWNSRKLIVGAEQGFYRRRNLEMTADYYMSEDSLMLYDNLDTMVDKVKAYYFQHRFDGYIP